MSGTATIEDVVRVACGGDPTAGGEQLLRRAYRIAERAHRGQLRRSGDPYLTHPVSVALLLAQWGADCRTVAAGLLHDVPVQHWRLLRRRRLAASVGRDVLRLMDDLEALSADPASTLPGLGERAGRGDPGAHRLIQLKLADRLHNARTWDYVPAAAARARAWETKLGVVDIARRAGLPAVAAELAALADQTLFRRATAEDLLRPRAGTDSGNRVVDDGCDVAAHVLRRALLALPASHRPRYEREWAADLAVTHGRRQRLALALGLLYAAQALRRDHANREPIFPRPSR